METTGNFLTQPNKDFPLDCETLDMLQHNAALAAALGNLCGDKLILSGCEASADGSRRGGGLVFVRTRSYPEGEVMRWEGGDTTGGMYVKSVDTPVSAMGVDYPKAYTLRTLAPGVGSENFRWEDFKKPKTPAELEEQISDLRGKLTEAESRIKSEPLGIVKMWAGVKVPEGYALCDGAMLRISEYPDLYATIGKAFNGAVNYNGNQNTTQEGFFRLPDLRGRFVVGHSDVDNDYKKYGNGGGEKKHTLSIDEMPSHSHAFKDYYYVENQSTYDQGNYDDISTNGNVGSGDSDFDNTRMFYYRHKTETSGGGKSFENRPPYYVLAYIMKIR